MNNMEKLAYDIINFCKKWGMWKDVQIFTGGKCYSVDDDFPDKIKVREEKNPGEYTKEMCSCIRCFCKSSWCRGQD